MFVDIAKISIKAGDGGNGAVAFRREKYVAAGGPNGGDGGKGGDIIFVADDSLSTLSDFRYKRKYKAANGADGGGNNMTGKSADNLIIKVPRGTIIRELSSGKVMSDMSSDEPFVAAKGGKGGKGNARFATATRQTPRFAKDGMPGESWDISLELQLLADVGLIGYPSVGKSSLISVVSEAKPKIAAYHFTTLIPNLGVVRIDDGVSFVMADIPGLIEGASEGVGLGHEFLKHVKRCRLLIHIIDISGSEGRDPFEDYRKINAELEKFDAELAERPRIIAGNKIDLATDEQREAFKNFIEKEELLPYFEICAPISEGTEELVNYTAETLSKLPPMKKYEPEIIPTENLLGNKEDKSFKITKQNDVYHISAPFLIKVLNKVDIDFYETLQYFQKVLINCGIIDALREAGIEEGDTVNIYDFEFEFVE